MSWEIRQGNCLEVLSGMENESVQTCVTSPPYWGLRDYGTATWEGGDSGCNHRVGGQVEDNKAGGAIVAGIRPGVDASLCLDCGAQRIDSQLGLEPTPEQYVENLVAVMREVRRVLRKDGTLWLNLGDSYAGSWGAQGHRETPAGISGNQINNHPKRASHTGTIREAGIKPKDLVGIPWRVAFALQADGWWLRSDIVWSKPNPMPESVTDRPTRAHEYIFLLTKSQRYFYDADAIREEDCGRASGNGYDVGEHRISRGDKGMGSTEQWLPGGGRNKRSVWEITTQPYPEAHFATFPPKLIEPCILAGSAQGDAVLDPFAGSGTTGVVTLRHDRSFVGIELSPEYVELARNRIRDDAPLFNHGTEIAA